MDVEAQAAIGRLSMRSNGTGSEVGGAGSSASKGAELVEAPMVTEGEKGREARRNDYAAPIVSEQKQTISAAWPVLSLGCARRAKRRATLRTG